MCSTVSNEVITSNDPDGKASAVASARASAIAFGEPERGVIGETQRINVYINSHHQSCFRKVRKTQARTARYIEKTLRGGHLGRKAVPAPVLGQYPNVTIGAYSLGGANGHGLFPILCVGALRVVGAMIWSIGTLAIEAGPNS